MKVEMSPPELPWMPLPLASPLSGWFVFSRRQFGEGEYDSQELCMRSHPCGGCTWSEDPCNNGRDVTGPPMVQSSFFGSLNGALSFVTDTSLAKSSYGHLIHEIKLLMLEWEFVPVKIDRSQNKVSHSLVNYARMAHNTGCWL